MYMRIISVTISALLCLGVLASCKGKEELREESKTISSEETDDYDSSVVDQIMVDTQQGNWEKHYFKDEFGELDYSNPFLFLSVNGRRDSHHDIELGVLYRPSGSFSFKLFEYNGRLIRDILSSNIIMTIRVNGQDIGPISLPVNKNEFYIYGEDSHVISTIFNEGTFSISLRDEGYLDDYHYLFHINEPKGGFEQAVTKLLNSEYFGE